MEEYSDLSTLIAEAKAGNGEALAQIYEKTVSIVYNIAAASLDSEEEAKDAVSEVYIRVFGNLKHLREDHSFLRWLTVITKNVCVDRKREEQTDESMIPLLSGNKTVDTIEDWHRTEAMENTLHTLMQTLPENQQRAVEYVYFRQLSIGQAAALENCSVGTIKSRLFYARETLRRAIADEEKRSGDKLYSPVAAAALSGLLMLPCSLSPEEAAQILVTVFAALQMRAAAEGDAPIVIPIRDAEDEKKSFASFLRRRYLIRFSPAIVLALTAVVGAAVISVGLIGNRIAARDADTVPAGSEALYETDIPAETPAPPAEELHFTTAHGAEISGTLREDGTVLVHAARSEAEHLDIPREIDGYPVTEIAEDAFAEGCEAVQYLYLSEAMRIVPGKAIASLVNLAEIAVPTASPYLKAENGILYSKDGTRLIAYPAAAPYTKYRVPDAVKVVGAYALNSEKLTEIEFAQYGVERLEEYSLSGLSRVEWFRIPNSVSEIGDHALDCPSVTYIYSYAGTGQNTWSWGGALISYDKTHFIHYPNGKTDTTYTLPRTVLTVGANAFYGADSLTEIIVPAAVTEVHADAFAGCANLRKVTFLGENTVIAGGESLNFSREDCRAEYVK